MLQVRLATPWDLPVILGLIDGAAEWLRTRDTDQWAQPWPTQNERDARVLRGLLACSTWLVEDYEIPVATVTYWPDSYSGLWTDAERDEPAGYMSRLVVNRKYAGAKTGASLIDWVGARVRDEFGAEYLRIDVWTTNERLHSYYRDHGFHFLRYHYDQSYPSSALFQKKTSDIESSAGSEFSEVRAIAAAGSGEVAAKKGNALIGGHDSQVFSRGGQEWYAANEEPAQAGPLGGGMTRESAAASGSDAYRVLASCDR